MNSYCWLHSTYSVAARYEGSAGHEFAHKGVGPDVNDKAGHTYHRCDDGADDDGKDVDDDKAGHTCQDAAADDDDGDCDDKAVLMLIEFDLFRFYQWIGFMFVLQVGF